MFFFLILILIGMSLEAQTEASRDSFYVAAVYEHNVILNPAPRVPLSRLEALRHLSTNLDIYEEQAARAAFQVQIINDVRLSRFIKKTKKPLN